MSMVWSFLVLVYALTYRRDGDSVGQWLIFSVLTDIHGAYLPGGGGMCRRGSEIVLMHENFSKDFKVALDICGPMDDISSDKPGVMNGAPVHQIDSARRNPLDEQHSMARLVRELRELTSSRNRPPSPQRPRCLPKSTPSFPPTLRWCC